MVFSSLTFLFYFLPIVLAVYYALFFSRKAQNVWLLFASLVFYAWGEPIYVGLLILSILVNYIAGLLVGRWTENAKKKATVILVIACVYNLGMLFVFKYLGFVCQSALSLVGAERTFDLGLLLPIGISFYTFQALSYVIDIYRQKTKAQKNPLWVGLYIAFFPQLVAGPIVRYTTIEDQILNRKASFAMLSKGVVRFTIGLSKKVLLANQLAILADAIFSLNATGKAYYSLPVAMAWLGAICYTLQIYMDFSGYSDMAIGLGQMFGFTFEENFNYPYVTQSIGEFWRRWHISLGSWFREYVYIPLGGSRVGNKDRMVVNLLIVWTLTGIWHGANWTFLLWGFFNFLFIMLERLFDYDHREIPRWIKHIYAMFVVIIGWVMFRADNLKQFGEYFFNLFGRNDNALWSATTGAMIKENLLVLILAIAFSMPVVPFVRKKLEGVTNANAKFGILLGRTVALVALMGLTILFLVKGGYNPFIYFNF